MSNFASLRNQVLMSTSVGSSLPLERRQEVFDAAWAACKQDESVIGDTYVYMLKAIVPPAPAPPKVDPPPAPADPVRAHLPSGPRIDMGAMQVVIDTLSASLLPGSPYVFDAASRRAVRDELLAELRRVDVVLILAPNSNTAKTTNS